VNRTDFQVLARTRLDDAAVLLAAQRASAAFYLVGYALECALKACVAKNTPQYEFPASPEFVREYVWTHSFRKLLVGAGLEHKLKNDAPSGSRLDANWAMALVWSEGARYRTMTLEQAQGLYAAITDPDHGVLAWVQRSW
jgi:hypothetical protein